MPLFFGGLRRLPGQEKFFTSFKRWLSGQNVFRQMGLGAALCLILAVTAFAFFGGNACAVIVGGRVVAIADNEKNARKALGELVELKSEQAGRALAVGEKVSYRGIRVNKDEVSDMGTLKEILDNTLSFRTTGTAVIVNGDTKIILKQKDDAQKLLDWIKSVYPVEPDDQVNIKETVEIAEVPAPVNDLLDLEDAKKLVLLGTSKIQQYTVKEGDTLEDISAASNINLEQLLAANPGMDPDRLSIGQVLNLSKEEPLITVVATRQETVQEEIPYQVEVKKDDNLFLGEKKVVRKGVPGQRTVTYRITRENGLEAGREVCEQNITSEAITEVVVKGSQTMLASRGGSAHLSWPCSGSIVSPFGIRDGRMHEGIDLDAGYGSPVISSAGGTVIATGWEGGYGKEVEVSHGSGVVTRYAHLSSINVSTGQQVDRGQVIGLVGATGNATGPHLHFEVIVGGQQRNPVNFLP
ncbi:MAG: Murein DD-endopeptidase MepM [Pelotomaculum sp. PtaU1.Bin035]|nr:MAG: Murein DD-endopeptidase MepM [Pelotomaculum sp. PtaU1.Bin035]